MRKAKQPWSPFRQVSHALRIQLWLLAALCLLFLPIAISLFRVYSWIPLISVLLSFLCLAWAVWATVPPQK